MRDLIGILPRGLRDRSAGVMILTALSMPLLLCVIGFAADFGYASYINQRFARAADTAALSAVSQAAATAVGGYSNTTGLQNLGSNLFVENINQLSISGATTSVTVTSDGSGGVIASANYSYSVKPLFGGVFGRNFIPVSGTVSASAKPITYGNYYILVDVSQSMGIGATAADMTALYNRVVANNSGSSGETGCVFGCHTKQATNAGPMQQYSNEDLAHLTMFGPPITLRIDAAIVAIQNIVATAANVAGTAANIKIGLYTIQDDPNSTNT